MPVIALDLGREDLADAAEARAVEGVEPLVAVGLVHALEREALGDDDERRAAAVVRLA